MSLEAFLDPTEEANVYATGMVKIKPSQRIVGEWYSYNRGKSWSRYDPVVEQMIIDSRLEREKIYLYACYLYYHAKDADNGGKFIESPLPDDEFDILQNSLDIGRANWSEYFKAKIGDVKPGFMKAEAFMITFTDEEKKAALEWANKKNEKS
jgi:hypothetical protein